MAIVNVSLDTQSRNLVLTINGVLVAQDGCSIDRYTDHDGIERIFFSYVVENVNDSGIQERRQFTLLSPEEIAASANIEVDDNGLVSQIIHDNKRVNSDIQKYLKK